MICAVHNKEMRQNAKGYFCSTPIEKSPDGSQVTKWCDWKPTNGQANPLQSVPNGVTKGVTVDYDKRSARIERQHSQDMAIQFLSIPNVHSDRLIDLGLVRELTEWFQKDLENA